MTSRETKISKQAAACITRHITSTIPDTLEIITKLGIATSHSVIMAAYKTLLLSMVQRNLRKKIPCKNLDQERFCLTSNSTFNNLAPLSSPMGARLNSSI